MVTHYRRTPQQAAMLGLEVMGAAAGVVSACTRPAGLRVLLTSLLAL